MRRARGQGSGKAKEVAVAVAGKSKSRGQRKLKIEGSGVGGQDPSAHPHRNTEYRIQKTGVRRKPKFNSVGGTKGETGNEAGRKGR